MRAKAKTMEYFEEKHNSVRSKDHVLPQGTHTIGCVADCYFKVNVLDLPFASPIAIYR